MPVIDDRGRVFGRVNLFDALVAIMALGLIPLAYGAFLMFRVPTPTIAAVSPDHVPEQTKSAIRITGENLRPFLDVRFGTVLSEGFLLESPTRAEVRVPALPAGTYDLTLVDGGRVLLRKPGGLTVVAPVVLSTLNTELQASGTFVEVSAADARTIVVGAKFGFQGAPAVAEVVAVRDPQTTQRVKVGVNSFVTVPSPEQVRVPAVVRVRCAIRDGACRLGDAAVVQEAFLALSAPGGQSLRFLINDVLPSDARVTLPPARAALATLKVRFVAGAEVLDVMKPGDIDVPGGAVVTEADRAVLVQIGSDRQAIGGQVVMEGLLRRSLQVQQTLFAVTGTVQVPVVYNTTGWTYKDRPVKAGAGYNFETVGGGMTGWVLDMKLGQKR